MATELEKQLAEALRLAREWFSHEDPNRGPQAFEVVEAADQALAAADAVGGEAVAGSARGFAEWIKSQPADREPTTLDEALSEYLRTHPAPAAPAVPEGYALVPVELTREMLGSLRANGVLLANTVWREVLAAAANQKGGR